MLFSVRIGFNLCYDINMKLPDLSGLVTGIKELKIKLFDFTRNNSPSHKRVIKQKGERSQQADVIHNTQGLPPEATMALLETTRTLANMVSQQNRNTQLRAYVEEELRNTEHKISAQSFDEPAVQASMVEAGRISGIKADESLRKLLAKLVVRRVSDEIVTQELPPIVYAEAIKVVEQLTDNQLKIITLLFILRYTKNEGIVTPGLLMSYITTMIRPFLDFEKRVQDFQHIEYSGAALQSIGSWNLYGTLAASYPEAFPRMFEEESVKAMGLTVSQAKKVFTFDEHDNKYILVSKGADLEAKMKSARLNEERKTTIRSYESYTPTGTDVKAWLEKMDGDAAKLMKAFDQSELDHYRLTSVGFALGITYWEQVVGAKVNHAIWVK